MKAQEAPNKSILWRRLDIAGHESARVFFDNPFWRLAGTAIFTHDQQPCRMDYSIRCDSGWQTLSATVAGWIGNQTIEIDISADADHNWWLNGQECSAVAGCIDLDLNFSPSTNLLPIRRLDLPVGQEAQVRAAWLRFPTFVLEPLEQVYRRIDAKTYQYESAVGRFKARLQVDEQGFPTEYANIWRAE